MNEPIRVFFQLTPEDILIVRKWHWRRICSLPYRRSIYIFSAFIVCLCIYSIVVAGPSVPTSLFLLGLFYLYVVRRYERRWWVRREFKKRPDKNSDIEWLINADKLRVKSQLMEAELIWSAFVRVVQTRDGFIFYSNEGVFNFFPRRGFQNDSEFQRLAQLAEKHAKKFFKMS